MTKIKLLLSRFHPLTEEGMLFSKIWLKGGYGAQVVLSEKFNISVGDVYRVRRRLGLPALYSKNHPGYKRLMKRIKRMYLWDGKSCIWIGHALRIHPETVRKKLKAMGVNMRPDYITNPLYSPFKKAEIGHTLILKKIKDLYEKGMTVRDISKELKLDHDAVSKKLKAMGFEVWRSGGKRVKAGYPCAWCGKIMEFVNVSTGRNKQLYCSTRCVSKAKMFRKYLRGNNMKYGPEALESMTAHVNSLPEERKRIIIADVDEKQLLTYKKKGEGLR